MVTLLSILAGLGCLILYSKTFDQDGYLYEDESPRMSREQPEENDW